MLAGSLTHNSCCVGMFPSPACIANDIDRTQVAKTLLLQAPLALDALGSYVLVAFAPLELTLLHVAMTGALLPNG